MLTAALILALALVAAALALSLWRLLRGPSAADRILALDTLYINTIALVVLLVVLLARSAKLAEEERIS